MIQSVVAHNALSLYDFQFVQLRIGEQGADGQQVARPRYGCEQVYSQDDTPAIRSAFLRSLFALSGDQNPSCAS